MTVSNFKDQCTKLGLNNTGSLDVIVYDEMAKKSTTFTVKKITGDITGSSNPSVLLDCTGPEDCAPTPASDFAKFTKLCDPNCNIMVKVDVTGCEIDNGAGVIERPVTGLASYSEIVSNQKLVKVLLKAPLNLSTSF